MESSWDPAYHHNAKQISSSLAWEGLPVEHLCLHDNLSFGLLPGECREMAG